MNTTTPKKVLIIKSSPGAADSISNRMADELVAKLSAKTQEYSFVVRDLNEQPAQQYTNDVLNTFYGDQNALTDAQKAISQPSEEYIKELMDADIVVLASPMHNFSISSLLKSYIDQICRIGYTFKYSASGVEGLVKDKQALIISSSGMDFQTDETRSMDFQTPYLQQILGFIGIEDIHIVPVQGLSRSASDVLKIKQTAIDHIDELALNVF